MPVRIPLDANQPDGLVVVSLSFPDSELEQFSSGMRAETARSGQALDDAGGAAQEGNQLLRAKRLAQAMHFGH